MNREKISVRAGPSASNIIRTVVWKILATVPKMDSGIKARTRFWWNVTRGAIDAGGTPSRVAICLRRNFRIPYRRADCQKIIARLMPIALRTDWAIKSWPNPWLIISTRVGKLWSRSYIVLSLISFAVGRTSRLLPAPHFYSMNG